MAHEGLHEAEELLEERVIDRHRAIESLVEEFEAIDWYDQRVHATRDADLASVLAHNRDDEKEHAAMALEWIRRHDPALDEQLRLYLFTDGPLVVGGGHGSAERLGRRRRPGLRARHRKPAGGVMTDHLLRSLAPISEAAWAAIDDEARSRLSGQLAARKLVDFVGPSGWDHSAIPLGHTVDVDSPFDARGRAAAHRPAPGRAARRVHAARGASSTTSTAARVTPTSPRSTKQLATSRWPRTWRCSGDSRPRASRVCTTRPNTRSSRSRAGPTPTRRALHERSTRSARSASAGRTGIAIAPDIYTRIVETTEHGGYPVFNHLEAILGGPVVWAPGVGCGLVLSMRGGDFRFESGQDIAIGYRSLRRRHRDAVPGRELLVPCPRARRRRRVGIQLTLTAQVGASLQASARMLRRNSHDEWMSVGCTMCTGACTSNHGSITDQW